MPTPSKNPGINDGDGALVIDADSAILIPMNK
jgi:hypothetical protein